MAIQAKNPSIYLAPTTPAKVVDQKSAGCLSTVWKSIRVAADILYSFVEIGVFWIKQNIFCVSLPKLNRVNDDLYRGAQPSKSGFRELRDLGVKSVINLRESKPGCADSERKLVESLGMNYHSIPLDYDAPEQEHILEFVKVMQEKEGPFFIHCYFGADRTGFMTALYRIFIENCKREEAIDEMVNGGFGHHAFRHPNLRACLETLDIDAIRHQLNSELA